MSAAAARAALLIALALTVPVPRLGARPLGSAAQGRVELDFRSYHGPAAIDSALKALAEAHAGALHLVEVGRSRAGRPIQVAVLGEGELESVLARPALFAGDALLGGDPAGGEALLHALDWILANRRRDPALGALFAERALWLAPCLDPDARAARLGEGGPESGAAFDLNFPIGWLPSHPGRAAGPFPLSEPEAEALARLWLAHPSLAVTLLFDPRAPGTAETGGRDSASLAKLRAAAGRLRAGELRLAPLAELERHPGGALEFGAECCAQLALAASWVRAPAGPEQVPALAAELAGTLAALAAELPKLAFDAPRIERLGPELWRLELLLGNRGGVATENDLAAERSRGGALTLRMSGAELVAAAERRGEGSSGAGLELLHFGPGELELDRLAGGASHSLSLFAAAAPGALVQLEVNGARAGRALLMVALE